MFGKIISIDLKTKEFEMVSMGHRNPQGLFYDQNLNIIINTEHGPTGGDEININFNPDNETIENYGWPISTY
jgi:glucose/arabinose dehydrogenase